MLAVHFHQKIYDDAIRDSKHREEMEKDFIILKLTYFPSLRINKQVRSHVVNTCLMAK